MRVGIDGYNLAIPHGTGIATYGRMLTQTLTSAGHAVDGLFGINIGTDPTLRETLFFEAFAGSTRKKTMREARHFRRQLFWRAVTAWRGVRAIDVPLTDRVERGVFQDRLPAFDRIASCPNLFDIAYRHFRLYDRFLELHVEQPPDVMHWTYPVPVRLAGARNIYTLHDLVPLRLPYTTLDAKPEYKRIVQQCVAKADHICTVSQASADDIVLQLGANPAGVTNTYQISAIPAAAQDRPIEEDAAYVRGLFGLEPQRYFLFYGSIEPKKNVGRLLQAYFSLQTDTPLVIVSSRSWQSNDDLALMTEIETMREQRGDPRAIVRIDHLDLPLLQRMIRCAKAVLFPSIFEGFGLPVLEAMQLGTPVLTSTTSSLPEVAGDAALLVDPYDIFAIADGLRALDGDPLLRRRLSADGRIQARLFSQEAYRTRLETMYATVLADDRR